ncbi:MAG: transposase [Candidatus Buchananbacteria bacterium]|nr:transposase [Candidatus Buchananbacteria bacterium]
MNRNYFKNKYLVNSTRLPIQDYSADGYYFFTICVKHRKCLLGRVKNGTMGLSEIGCIVWEEWYKTEKIRKNIRLDEFIVMPNHLHGIIEIDNKVETHCNASLQSSNKFGPQTNNLASTIRGLKGAAIRKIKKLGYDNFCWQSGFYEHIIRPNNESLDKIRWYIKYNPPLWDRDRNNPINIKI